MFSTQSALPPPGRPPPTPLAVFFLLAVLNPIVCVGVASSAGAEAARGPHHPRGQVAHTHYRPHRPPAAAPAAEEAPAKLTSDQRLLHDAEHIREDLGEWVTKEDTSRMSPEELEFHYFQIHDVDNNTKLDGLEMLQAILHTAPHSQTDGGGGGGGEGAGGGEGGGEGPPPETDNGLDGATAGGDLRQEQTVSLQDDFSYFVELIDRVLLEDDVDRDGYLSYVEYVMGRQRDDQQYRQTHQQRQQQRQAAAGAVAQEAARTT